MANNELRNLGFIGTGAMGAPMVRRLLAAGYTVRVWNRTASKVEPLIAAGASRANSPAEAVADADVMLSRLADAAALEAALFDDNGVAQSAGAHSQFVDFSTIGPRPTMEFAKQLRSRCGSSWVDAPVSGGTAGAEQGRLVIFCGGAPGDIGRLERIFSVLSQRWTRVGDLGAGQTLKLCNQLIVSVNLIAIAEALTLALAGGLDPKMVPDALTAGFADSLPMQIFGRRMAEGITLPVLGELGLMLKDLSATDELARLVQCRLPLMGSAMQIYRHAAERGLVRRDLATLVSLYQSE